MHTNKFNLSLFIFRRDLRLEDNIGLINALKLSNQVLPCFIFNKEQVCSNNIYRSDNAIQFMTESVIDLKNSLIKRGGNLYLFYGNNLEIIDKINKNLNIDAIFVNRDYTPYSKIRDQEILNFCDKNKISFNSYSDLLLNEPEDIKSKSGKDYLIFTPFYKACLKKEVLKPIKNMHANFYKEDIDFKEQSIPENLFIYNDKILLKGGRSNGLKLVAHLKNFNDYKVKRDYLFYITTLLSAHIKFGTYSIREIYWHIANDFGKGHELIRQLYWRDFFTHIAFNHPKVFGNTYKEQYNDIKWKNDKDLFNLWCSGQTGFPIVDAGMRQLNQSGYMHNRARLIVSSFLVKDLNINWQWGEKYFAQKLIDYDPSVNNGNWQWIASTGVDSQPYFRIFNPWIQQKKFDPNCVYIKKWVPELQNLDIKIIHNWHNQADKFNKIVNYKAPIINHKNAIIESKRLYTIKKD